MIRLLNLLDPVLRVGMAAQKLWLAAAAAGLGQGLHHPDHRPRIVARRGDKTHAQFAGQPFGQFGLTISLEDSHIRGLIAALQCAPGFSTETADDSPFPRAQIAVVMVEKSLQPG